MDTPVLRPQLEREIWELTKDIPREMVLKIVFDNFKKRRLMLLNVGQLRELIDILKRTYDK